MDRFFFASSACVYRQDLQDDSDVNTTAEEGADSAEPDAGYGWEKLFSKRMCRHFREDVDVETRVAHYHGGYGSLRTYGGDYEKAPSALCRKLAQVKLRADMPVKIWGDGSQTRSFTWVGDCLEGTRRLLPLTYGSR